MILYYDTLLFITLMMAFAASVAFIPFLYHLDIDISDNLSIWSISRSTQMYFKCLMLNCATLLVCYNIKELVDFLSFD